MSVRAGSGLFTDLYELTMAAGYLKEGIATREATFDLFIRSMPASRQFFVSAGQSDVVAFLENLSITKEEVDYLSTTGFFDDETLDTFAGLSFEGDVWMVPEGEVMFPNEPILRVTAPLIQAQIIETKLINLIGSNTMIASKAARVAIACGGRPFMDFSARRDHGGDAAMQAAKASWIGGASGTSLVSAGYEYGLPLSGTMAHAYVMSFDDELDAFMSFARTFPTNTVLLIDTYDTVAAAHKVVRVAEELSSEGVRIAGVRLDSGDLVALSRAVREILDAGGLTETAIFASGDLDEYRITELLGAGAPISAFGVGTQLGTSADAPNLGAVYKLVADENGPKMKLAADKTTLPGVKQVWRVSHDGVSNFDVIGLADEEVAGGKALLYQTMSAGQTINPVGDLNAAKETAAAAIAALPSRLRTLQQREEPYEVRISQALRNLTEKTRATH